LLSAQSDEGRRCLIGANTLQVNLARSYDDVNHTHSESTPVTGAPTYTWNARNQLESVTKAVVAPAFSYDALGRRLSKTAGGTTTSFLPV
jgi:hypothetical protein